MCCCCPCTLLSLVVCARCARCARVHQSTEHESYYFRCSHYYYEQWPCTINKMNTFIYIGFHSNRMDPSSLWTPIYILYSMSVEKRGKLPVNAAQRWCSSCPSNAMCAWRMCCMCLLFCLHSVDRTEERVYGGRWRVALPICALINWQRTNETRHGLRCVAVVRTASLQTHAFSAIRYHINRWELWMVWGQWTMYASGQQRTLNTSAHYYNLMNSANAFKWLSDWRCLNPFTLD